MRVVTGPQVCPDVPTESADQSRERRGRRAQETFFSPRVSAAVAICVYVVLSVVSNWTVWSHGVTHSIQTSGGTDIQEEIWFLAQTPWAILHGINPFANNLLNFPHGINLVDNTSMALLGILGAPITLLLGPIATFNILFDVALASSATACYFMVRRFVTWQPAAFAGGLLYGFSPFAVATGNGHLFLLFGAFPPLTVIVLDRVFRTRETSPAAGGALFALCLAGQFYVSSEVFASLALMLGLAAAVVVIHHLRRRLRPNRQMLQRFAVAAVLVGVVPLGYGAWMAIAGPYHIVGPAQTRVDLNGLSADPVGWVAPTINQRFTLGFANVGDPLVAQRDAKWHVIIDNAAENGTYIGIPLLLLLVVGVWILRRLPVIRFGALMALLATALSLGNRLHINGHLTGIPLPFIVLAHLPLLDSSVAARYLLFFWLFAAVILGVVVDRAHSAIQGVRLAPAVADISCWLLLAAALIPLTPSWPYSGQPWATPAWFTGEARSLPSGTSVLVYPVPSPVDSSAMVWQAEAHFAFRLAGGYAVLASPRTGAASFYPPPSSVLDALGACHAGASPATNDQIMSDLADMHLDYVAVPTTASYAGCAESLFTRLLGTPRRVQDVLLWKLHTATSSGS